MRRRASWTPAPAGQAAAAGAAAPLQVAQADARFYDLSPAKIWAYVRTQPASYWFLVFYLFFEYVRPQAVYSAIYGMQFAFWCLLLCLVCLILEGGAGRRAWTAADSALAAFTVIVLLSSLTAVYPQHSFANIRDYLNWVAIYLLITTIVNTERRFLVFALAFLLYSTKMSQFGFRYWVEAGFVPFSYGVSCGQGFFQNSGECGVQMAIFFPMALFFVLALKPYVSRTKFLILCFMPVSAGITIISSSSRGSMLALAAILLWLVARRPKNVKALLAVGMVAAATWALIPQKQKARFSEMGEDATSLTRLQYWADARKIMSEYPVLGIGYYNWLPYYRSRYMPAGQLPHNIFYQAGAELGYTGLGAFLVLILATFHVNRKTRRLARALPDGGRFLSSMASGLDGALIGYAVAGYFVTVLYYPFFWINLAFTVALHGTTVRELRKLGLPQGGTGRRGRRAPAYVAAGAG